MVAFLIFPQKAKILFRFGDLWVLIGFVLIMISFLSIYRYQTVPPGADMATHTYTAQVISDNRLFPRSYYPLVPIDAFGFMPYGMSVIISYVQIIVDLSVQKSSFISDFVDLSFYRFSFIYFPK